MKHFFHSRWLVVICLLLSTVASSVLAQVPLTTINSPYTQDFNTLASTATSSTVPAGFAFIETGANLNTTYTAGTGSSNTADTYSFGVTGTVDRAFGALGSSNLVPTIGASFVNNTGATITSLAISYSGEKWRLGAANRTDRLDFQYSLSATSLTTGTYTDENSLDFIVPATAGTVGALDGNATVNKTAVSSTINGLSIAPGATFWIRYSDFDASGNDDGLGIDDFSLTPIGVAPCAQTVTNTNTGATFCTIQAAVDAPATLSGHTINVGSGTFDELVTVNKALTIQGAGASSNVTFTGTVPGSAIASLFTVAASDVTIQNLGFTVDLGKTHSAIHTTGNDRNNLRVVGNFITPTGTPAAGTFGRRNAIAINPQATVPNYTTDSDGFSGVVVQSNTVTAGSSGLSNSFRAAVQMDLAGGIIGGATSTLGNSLTAGTHDVICVFTNQGDLTIQNNRCGGGGIQISDPNPNAGTITVASNILDGSFVQPASGALPSGALMRIRNNGISGIKSLLIQNNTFQNLRWGISAENNGGISITGNTFTPNAGATDFRHISINSKTIASNSATLTEAQMQTLSGTLTGNTFNGVSTPGSGTAIAFLNHRTAGAKFGSFILGATGSENTFAASIGTFIRLDNSTGLSSAYASPFGEYAGVPATNMGPWAQDYDIRANRFDVGAGPQLPNTMTATQRATLETQLFHKPDDVSVGQLRYFDPVRNLTQNTSFQTIGAAIAAANANDVIELAEYAFNERVVIDKPLSLTGASKTNTIIDGTGLSGTGSGIAINSGITNVTIKNLTVQNFSGANPNSNAGIFGTLGNSNLLVDNVRSLSNVGGAGFYANGPVQGVTITNSTFSGHTGGARGIVIWNGFKQNINISNNIVSNNNCCGIELQDGTVSGVTITGNTVFNNADNGIGVVGLKAGAGLNLISNNILGNNGRFGIEIKNPNGTGLTSGDGSIVVENNVVSFTATAGMNNRDHAGISVYRRGLLVNNSEGYPDVPTGVVIRTNTVSGYQHLNQVSPPTESEGFGIVIEGTNHSVTGNTLTNNNIGVQQQGGGHPNANYVMNNSGDGDQAAGQSPGYFGRGNAAVACGNTVSGNNFSGNTTDTRNAGPGAGKPELVKNLTTGSVFCTIQSAVDAATAGNSLSVSAGTYNELVTINKALTIQGAGASSIVTYTGAAIAITGNPGDVTPTLFKVTAPNVTIQNLTMNVDLSKIRSAIHTSGTTTNLTILGNIITPSGTPGNNYGIRNAIAINPNLTNNGYTYDNAGFAGVVVKGNTVNPTTSSTFTNSFRAAVQMDLSSGTIGGSNPADGNTLTSVNHDVNVRFTNQGPVTIQNNTSLGGGIQFAEPNSGAGLITIANNTLTGATVQPATGQLGTGALMRIQNNTASTTVNITNNSFTNYRWGMSVENFNKITLNGNTFTPRANATDYRSISFNTKLLSSSSATVTPVVIDGTLTNNIFNGSGAAGGTGIAFFNHRQDGATPSIGTYTLGTAGNENTFNAGIAMFLRLDNSTGPSSGFVSPFGDYTVSGAPSTTMNYWTPDLDVVNNKFDVGSGLKLARNLSSAERSTLDGQVFDKNDDANVGRILYYFPVRNVTQNTDFSTIQSAVNAANSGDVISAAAGTYVENITIPKSLTILGANSGINPNTGTRVAESLILSPTTGANDAAYSGSLVTLFSLRGNASNVVIDGFTLDGDNPTRTGQNNSVTINGADIDAAIGISGYGAAITGGAIRNNIFKNFSFDGVDYGSDGAPTFSTIANNSFDNIAYVSVNTAAGVAIIASDNGYANITGNTATRVRAGVQTNNFSQASTGGTPTISGNNFTAYRYGILHNLHYAGATGFVISDNTISGASPLAGTAPLAGIALSSIQTAVPVTVSGNTVNAGFPYGVESWNTSTTGTVILSGGTLQGSTAGVRITNRNRFGDATASKLQVNGVTIANSPVGVLAYDDPASAAGIPASVTVTANTQISGTGTYTAVAISGTDASASLSGNASSFVGNGSGTGVDVNGGMASVNTNRISNFGTGINVSNGGQLTGAANNFITGNTVSGVTYTADASSTQGMVTNNDLSGNSAKAITNGLASTTIAATCNWYGTANVDAQAATLFSGAVTYSPYLSSGTDNEAGTPGFQPVPGSCASMLMLTFTASPTMILTTGTTSLSATVSGGNTPYSYTFTGPGTITPSGNTASVSGIPAGVQTYTVVVRDATSPASQSISGTVSVTVTQANTAPVATANANQTATVGVAFAYTVNAFTDAETPNGLTYQASIDPANGFSFDPATRIISGTPSMSGVSSVTVTATDPGSLSASTSFTITVSPVPCPMSVTNVTTGSTYCTIQAAIDDPATLGGHTIRAGAYTYPEAVTVSKSLTILGANTGISGFGTRSAESVIDGGGTRTGLLVSAPNVVVDGFKFIAGQGTYGAAVAFNGQQTGVQILNNIFTDNVVGVVEPTANAAIKNNLFDGNNRAGAAGGSGIYTDVATNGLTIDNNEFKNHTTNSAVIFGATTSNTHQNLVFSKNYIHDNNINATMVYCVAVNGGTFSQNTITHPAGTAIKFAGANTSIQVLNNFLNTNGVGVRIADDGYGFGGNTGIEIHNNSLSNNSNKAIDNQETPTVNATCNWYGTTNVDAQAAALFGGSVTYSPYLSSGTDNEAGTPGFQPVPGSCASMLMLTFTASPTMILTTGTTTLSATVSGGNTPYSYTFTGPGTITPSGNTASVSGIPAGVQTYTVVVRDATSPASQSISGTVSVTVTQANTAPVATANANQTATVGVAFAYTVNAFTDAETPNGLTYQASIDPANGFSFDPATRIISGTPSMSGVSSVTVTATDPGSLSASTSFTITVSPAFGSGALTVLHQDVSFGQTTTNTILPYLQLANSGSAPIAYSAITVRYWLTVEGNSPITNFQHYYVQIGANNVHERYVPLATPRQGATGYVEYSFDAAAGSLGGGTNSGPIQNGFTKADYSVFNQSDDYSYVANRDYTANARITAYVNGVLVYGQEPSDLGPVTPLMLSLTANPTMLTTSGTTTLSATVSGGSAPYSYSFSGPGTITPSGNTASVSGIPAGVQTYTVVVRDATSPISQTISGTVSVTVTQAPVNTAPVATMNANQTATVGVAFSYLVNAFTDSETPNNLTYSASIDPTNGLSFDPATRIISGTPSMSGVSSVTITATDPGSLSASTSFTITVSPAPIVVTPLALTVTASPTVLTTSGTTTLSATVSGGTAPYSYTFTGPGTITPSGNTASVSGIPAGVQTYTVVVRDATSPASQTISSTVSVTVSAVNTAPVATANANQTATVGVAFSYLVNAFTDSETPNNLTYSASIDPTNGLSFDPATRIISGTPSMSGVSSVTVTATDPGSLSASTTFSITVSPAPVAGNAQLTVLHQDVSFGQTTTNTILPYLQLVNSGSAPIGYQSITVRYWLTVEGNSPITNFQHYYVQIGANNVHARYVPLVTPRQGATGYVEYSFDAAAGSLGGGTNSGPIQNGFTKADYSAFNQSDDYSYVANRDYTANARITAYVNGVLVYGQEPVVGARLGVSANEVPFVVQVLGNPLVNEVVDVRVSGAGGQSLLYQLTDSKGYVVGEQRVDQAGVLDHQRLGVGGQSAGVYLLRVSTPTQSRTVKVLKVE